MYWICEFQDGVFSLADRTFLVLGEFQVMIMIMKNDIRSWLIWPWPARMFRLTGWALQGSPCEPHYPHRPGHSHATSICDVLLLGRCLQPGREVVISHEWTRAEPWTSTADSGGSSCRGLGIGGIDWNGWTENETDKMRCLWCWWPKTKRSRVPKHDHLHKKWIQKSETCANEMQQQKSRVQSVSWAWFLSNAGSQDIWRRCTEKQRTSYVCTDWILNWLSCGS